MTAALPQEKANALIDDINIMVLDGVNPIRLSWVQKEAKKLEKLSYVDAKRVMGMIAALSGDAEEVDRHFNAAVNASGRDPLVMLNYATALGNIHHYTRCIDILNEAIIRSDPDDLTILRAALKLYLDTYNVDGVRDIQKLLDKLGQHNDDLELYTKLEAIDNVFSETGASWIQVSERIELVSDTLHKLGLTARMCTEILSGGIILYEINLDADLEKVMHAENAIHQKIAEQPYSPADRAIAFSCASV